MKKRSLMLFKKQKKFQGTKNIKLLPIVPSNRQSGDWNLCQHYNNECFDHEPLYGL